MMGRALALALLCSVALAGQAVFRSTVHYVSVDVVVTDKDDKPVGNLTAADFEITEAGKGQRISDFQFVSVPAVSRDIALAVASQPNRDVATNVPTSRDSRLFAIVIDDLHLIEQDTNRIKKTLTDLVSRFASDDDLAMVFVSRADLSINFTRNTSALMARIANIKEVLGFGLDALATGPSKTDAESDPTKASAFPGLSKFRLSYARAAAHTLSSVAAAIAGSTHSRRAIFFVTDGTTLKPFGGDFGDPLGLDFRVLQDDYLKVFADAKKADVPIYVIDPRGTVTPDDAIRGNQISSPAVDALIRHNIAVQHDNMATIAVNTGGRAIFNASDMARMMTEIVQENGTYYLLGYYPDPFVADGKFHELKVRVNRPGLRVRARAGYEAPSASRAAASVSELMNTAISSGVNVSGLALKAFAAPVTTDGKTQKVAVTVEVDYPNPADGATRLDDQIQLRLVALDPDAKQRAASTHAMRFTANAPATGHAKFLVNDVISVPNEPLTLRIAVGSQALAKTGTVQIPIERGGGIALALGGVALGFSGAARQAAMPPNVFEGLIPFQPTPAREFAAADRIRFFTHLYWTTKGTPIVKVNVSGPTGSFSVLPEMAAQPLIHDRRDATMSGMLPKLTAGSYQLLISATSEGKTTSRNVRFEVR